MTEPGSELANRDASQVSLTGYVPDDLQSTMTIARALASSSIIPTDLRGKPANCLVVMMYGKILDLPIMVAFNTISVVNGRPKLEAKLVLSLVRRAGHQVTWGHTDADSATLTISRGDREEEFTATFTTQDAVDAGLVTKKPDGSLVARSKEGKVLPWESWRRRMLRWRVVDEVTDVICPEVKMGFGVEGDEVLEAPTEKLSKVVAERTKSAQPDPVAVASEVANIEREFTGSQPHGSGELGEPVDATILCCADHREEDCCDPEDCSPCCRDCPTCPTEAAIRERNAALPTQEPDLFGGVES